jgi:hypothetical protein
VNPDGPRRQPQRHAVLHQVDQGERLLAAVCQRVEDLNSPARGHP